MRINNNIMALNTHRQFSVNNENVSKATEKLSSGFRINRAGDDAAGLAISEKMRAQIRGLEMAAKNSQDAISLVQTAEGALTETHAILQSMRELAVQASSDTNENLVDRAALDAVFQQLKEEIDDIASQTKFNDMHLLDGNFGSKIGVENTKAGIFDSDNGISGLSSVLVEGAKEGDIIEFVKIVEADGSGEEKIYLDSGDDGALTFADDFAGFGNTLVVADSLAENDTVAIHYRNVYDDEGDVTGKEYVGYSIIKDGADEEAIGAAFAKLGVTFLDADGGELSLAQADIATFDGAELSIGQVRGSGGQIQTGANEGDNLTIEISDMSAKALGLTQVAGDAESSDINITGREDAEKAVTAVNSAINQVSTQRANLGAYQNRLEHKINNLNTSAENLQAAESRIRDLDIAKEMTAFTRNSILVQASTAMLAQANSAPQAVLSLLR